jgi:hypothetical protein
VKGRLSRDALLAGTACQYFREIQIHPFQHQKIHENNIISFLPDQTVKPITKKEYPRLEIVPITF